MNLTASLHELHARLGQAAAASAVARERAIRAVARATDIHARAERVRQDATNARAQRATDPSRRESALGTANDQRSVQAFRIEGVVDDVPATAHWSPRGLECSPALLERMEIVVALGETFDPGGGRPVVQASLNGPLNAVLPTVIRAFSSVTSIELAVGPASPQYKAS
jgi:hypothetical protein